MIEICLGGIPGTSERDPLQFHCMNLVALLHANISKDQLAILFNLPIVEYSVSVLRHQYDVVGYLTIAMAKTAQLQAYHILAIGGWHHLWLRCLKASF